MKISGSILLLAALVTLVDGHEDETAASRHVDKSLYNGTKVDELLSLCRYPDNPEVDDTNFDSYYKNIVLTNNTRCGVLDIGLDLSMSSEDEYQYLKERFKELREVQNMLQTYHVVLTTQNFMAQGTLLIIIAICGIFLIVTGHYDYRTLFDKYHSDGSQGIPCSQYLRMGYVAAKVRVCHSQAKLHLTLILYSQT